MEPSPTRPILKILKVSSYSKVQKRQYLLTVYSTRHRILQPKTGNGFASRNEQETVKILIVHYLNRCSDSKIVITKNNTFPRRLNNVAIVGHTVHLFIQLFDLLPLKINEFHMGKVKGSFNSKSPKRLRYNEPENFPFRPEIGDSSEKFLTVKSRDSLIK